MTPISVSRRRFLGCSAAASLALTGADASPSQPLRVGVIGLGNRGTALIRSLLSISGIEVVAVADPEPRHRQRAQGIVQKAGRSVPDAYETWHGPLSRPDVQAVVAAVPCDLHCAVDLETLRAGKHLYAEKPLALTVEECDALLAEVTRRPQQAFHVGHQRRSNPRVAAGCELLRSGALGEPIEARASWTSSNGPMKGHGNWLGRRARSGDWMVEQAVHIWDILHELAGGPPSVATARGRKDLFASVDPGRDVTDWYTCSLAWESGFVANFTQSWIDPADDAFTRSTLRVLGTGGGFDFATGAATYRDRSADRQVLHPGSFDDTRAALERFVEASRGGHPSPSLPAIEAARQAVVTGLLVRRAVDLDRPVERSEIDPKWATGRA